MTAIRLPEVPVRTAAELTAWWAGMLDPLAFHRRDLWLAWITAAGRVLPTIVPIEDAPLVPRRRELGALVDLHTTIAGEFLGQGGHFALCLCRPGGPDLRDDDDAWAEVLRDLLDNVIDESWSLHLAAGGVVTPLVELPDGRPT